MRGRRQTGRPDITTVFGRMGDLDTEISGKQKNDKEGGSAVKSGPREYDSGNDGRRRRAGV